MSLIKRMRKQVGAYWSVSGFDRHGREEYAQAEGLRLRWEDKAQQFIDANNETVVSNSIVYVDRELKVGDVLILLDISDAGDITGLTEQQIMDALRDSLTDKDNPSKNEGSYPIRQFHKLPDLRNKNTLLTAYL